MIKELHIENFRCFGKSKLTGFSRINLIGGKNNAGKTAFLEALYLNNLPQVSTLLQMRGISQETIKAFSEGAWDSLFLNYNNQLKIAITAIDEHNVATSLQLFKSSSYSEELFDLIRESDKPEEELSNLFSNHQESDFSILNLSYQIGSDKTVPLSILASPKGVSVKNHRLLEDFKTHKINLIPTSGKVVSKHLAEEYDRCYLHGHAEKVKAVFNIIDPSIREIRTLTIGQPAIYLTRTNGSVMPLAVFGNAMNRVAEIILKLFNSHEGVLLIDEMENGIHHIHQKELWRWLFTLTAELNVQIFATTQSLEMLTAFREAALETETGEAGAYFEIGRHVKTHEIIAVKRNLESLDYALKNHRGVRGE